MFEYLRAYLQRRGKTGGQAFVICTCSAMSALSLRPLRPAHALSLDAEKTSLKWPGWAAASSWNSCRKAASA